MSRCLVLTTTFPRNPDDAVPSFVYDLSKKLRESGMGITVVAPHDEGANMRENRDGIQIYRFPYFFPRKYQSLAYHGGILPNFKKGLLQKVQAPCLFISEVYVALKLLRRQRFDAIYSHWLVPSGMVGAIAHKIAGIRHVMTVHAAGLLGLKKLPLQRHIADFVIKNTDQVAVVSSYIGEKLRETVSPAMRKILDQKIHIIPMGVDVNQFNIGPDKDSLKEKHGLAGAFVLLFLGRLAEKKGIPYLLRAISEISKEYSDVVLVICGDGPERKKLELLVNDMDIEDEVVFAGFVSNEEKIEYLSLADVLVVPSIVTGEGDTEGLPVVIMEGLAAGIPVIATDVGGISDAIIDQETGLLVETASHSALIDGVKQLREDKQLRETLQRNGQKFARDTLSWDIIAKRYLSVIEGGDDEE